MFDCTMSLCANHTQQLTHPFGTFFTTLLRCYKYMTDKVRRYWTQVSGRMSPFWPTVRVVLVL